MKPLAPKTKAGIAIALCIILPTLLLILISNPQDQRQIGSTYSKTPSGYGAWYAQVQEQSGLQVELWRRPSTELVEAHPETGQVLLRVNDLNGSLDYGDDEGLKGWLEAGNTLIQVGGRDNLFITNARFHSEVESPQGKVVLDTRRRYVTRDSSRVMLKDAYGAIAWLTRYRKGQVIQVNTPYLAANAYQDAPGNFAFLNALLTQNFDLETKEVAFRGLNTAATQVWIDEYLHGHVDKPSEAVAAEQRGIWGYLMGTPFAIAILQIAIAAIIALLALNRRFGLPQPLTEPTVNNSQAYIEALSAVLSKAEQQRFVVELLAPEQQRQLQVQLGLGTTLSAEDDLVAAWVAQTGKSPTDLEQLLRQGKRDRAWSKPQLISWLKNWQQIHRV